MSEPRKIFIPFTRWMPDQGDIGNVNLLILKSVVHYADGFIPIFPRQAKTAALVGDVKGIGINRLAGNTAGWKLYLGMGTVGSNDGALYEIDPDGTPNWTQTDLSTTTGPYTIGKYGWQFCAFSNQMIACCGNGEPVQYRADGAGDFVDMITSTEKPRFNFIVPIGLQILGVGIGATGVTSMPSGDDVIAWSDIDNIRTFDFGGILSDSLQFSDDYGGFTGAIGNLEFGALLFKENSIVMFNNSGPSGPELRTVWKGDGTIYPNSIFARGNRVYFWETGGQPAFWDGGSVVKIGYGTISQALNDTNWVDPGINVTQDDNGILYRLYGVYDSVTGNNHWAYRSEDVDAGNDNCDRILHCNVGDMHRFSVSNVSTASSETPNEASKILAMIDAPRNVGGFSDSPMILFVSEEGSDIKVFNHTLLGSSVYDCFSKFGTGYLTNPLVSEGEKLRTWEVCGIKPVASLGNTTVAEPTWRATITGKQFPKERVAEASGGTIRTATYESGEENKNPEGFLDVTSGNNVGYKFLNKIDVQFDVEGFDGESIPRMFRQFRGIEVLVRDGGEQG